MNNMLYFLKKQTSNVCNRDDGVWRNTRQDDSWKKNLCMPKQDFEALVAKLGP